MAGRLLLALLLTLAVEAGVAWLFGYRASREQWVIALLNAVTNPALNLFLLLLAWLGVDVTLGLVTLLEVPVVLAEWGLLVYAFGKPKKRLLALSLTANVLSFLAGVLLFWT